LKVAFNSCIAETGLGKVRRWDRGGR
jgi:hypothetical protein